MTSNVLGNLHSLFNCSLANDLLMTRESFNNRKWETELQTDFMSQNKT